VSINSARTARTPSTEPPLLQIEGLGKVYDTPGIGRRGRSVHALSGVTLELRAGETLGLVGESGCGKSTLAQLVVRLIDPSGGTIVFDGEDLGALRGRPLRDARRNVQLVSQDPFASLDPRMTVRQVLSEPLRTHHYPGSVTDRIAELLGLVGLAAEDVDRYPHEFSGGQRQRIAIARAIASGPKLIVLDEPVSALDVSVRSQILNLLRDLQSELGLTYLFISHDLSVVRSVCDRVAVMYLGRIVEQAEAGELFEHPRHPYTAALLSAIPIPDPLRERTRQRVILEGEVPSPSALPVGCAFQTRCPRATAACSADLPELEPYGSGDGAHLVRCFFPVLDGEPVGDPGYVVEAR
jgi:oligopeptide/dipeptide ABC transporter ATP-binding protein